MLISREVSKAIAKVIKVRIIMISPVIKIGSREIGGAIMIRASYMSLLEIVWLLQQVLKRCPWTT